MKWLPIQIPATKDSPAKVDQYAIRSGCGNYTIARVYAAGQCWYQAWKGKDFIGMSEDREQAKRYAEEDAAKPEAFKVEYENGNGI